MNRRTWPATDGRGGTLDYKLEMLRAEFPDFELSAEQGRGRWRYLARSRRPGLNPRIVITGDADELRAVLLEASQRRKDWDDRQGTNQPDHGNGAVR